MKRLLLMLNVLMALSFAFQAGAQTGGTIYIGNSGEGVLDNGKIYVRDLYEQNTHLHPVIGAELDPDFFADAALEPLVKLGVPREMMARKLTDLQKISPQLGHVILDGIRFYHWELVDGELTAPPVDGSPLKLTLIPLANRLRDYIRIARVTWEKLSAEHKVALVVHEVFYSYLSLQCFGAPYCTHNPGRMRELVGQAFSDMHSPNYRAMNVNAVLDIGPEGSRAGCRAKELVRASVQDEPFVLKTPMNSAARAEFINSFCHAVEKATPDFAGRKYVSLAVTRRPIKTVAVSYRAQNEGVVYDQFHLISRSRPATFRFSTDEDWSDSTFDQCVRKMDGAIQDWMMDATPIRERTGKTDRC